jgi:hypothetical protein
MAIKKTVPRKLKISSRCVKNKNECFPSLKNHRANDIIAETKNNITRKYGQLHLSVFINFLC